MLPCTLAKVLITPRQTFNQLTSLCHFVIPTFLNYTSRTGKKRTRCKRISVFLKIWATESMIVCWQILTQLSNWIWLFPLLLLYGRAEEGDEPHTWHVQRSRNGCQTQKEGSGQSNVETGAENKINDLFVYPSVYSRLCRHRGGILSAVARSSLYWDVQFLMKRHHSVCLTSNFAWQGQK